MSSTHSSSPRKSKLILGLIFVVLCARFLILQHDYDRITHTSMFSTEESGVDYRVWRGSGKGVLHMGDLLGTNIKSAAALANLQPPAGQKTVVVPSIHQVAFHDVTPESFLDLVANRHDVVLVDNFCCPEWEKVGEHAWYQNTSLSPGPYCLSEPETRLIDRLIKQYDVGEVFVYADNKMYVRLIETFLKYLQGMHIPYQIVYKT